MLIKKEILIIALIASSLMMAEPIDTLIHCGSEIADIANSAVSTAQHQIDPIDTIAQNGATIARNTVDIALGIGSWAANVASEIKAGLPGMPTNWGDRFGHVATQASVAGVQVSKAAKDVAQWMPEHKLAGAIIFTGATAVAYKCGLLSPVIACSKWLLKKTGKLCHQTCIALSCKSKKIYQGLFPSVERSDSNPAQQQPQSSVQVIVNSNNASQIS